MVIAQKYSVLFFSEKNAVFDTWYDGNLHVSRSIKAVIQREIFRLHWAENERIQNLKSGIIWRKFTVITLYYVVYFTLR